MKLNIFILLGKVCRN